MTTIRSTARSIPLETVRTQDAARAKATDAPATQATQAPTAQSPAATLEDLWDKHLGSDAPPRPRIDAPPPAPLSEKENNLINFRLDVTNGRDTLGEVLSYLEGYREGGVVDAEKVKQLGIDVNLMLGWASEKLSDASTSTTGLGHQTGVDLGVARRAADEAASIWNEAHGTYAEPGVLEKLMEETLPLIEKAYGRAEESLLNIA